MPMQADDCVMEASLIEILEVGGLTAVSGLLFFVWRDCKKDHVRCEKKLDKLTDDLSKTKDKMMDMLGDKI